MKYTVLRGMKDILPGETIKWEFAELTFRFISSLYNYSEIRTPVLEPAELFARSIGTDTDIVSKEMYSFVDKGERNVTLRPEATASVVRAALENNLISNEQMTKLFYIGPMFRYERPQAGRFRQFHQAGIEVFGSSDPFIDAEVIDFAFTYLKNLGLKNIEVDINSVGCKECRPGFIKALKKNLEPNLTKLCENCHARFDKNILRVLDCKKPGCQKYIAGTPSLMEFLCEGCRNHFEGVIEGLEMIKITFKVCNRLVRGLDYYTKTTFEIISGELGAQNAVCGGGRYDNLVSDFGGQTTPAVGFAVGLERLIAVMESQNITIPISKKLDVYIATLGTAAKKKGFQLINELRSVGIHAETDYLDKSLKSQMKIADRLGASFALIIGDEEILKGTAILKNMKDSSQKEIRLGEAITQLRNN